MRAVGPAGFSGRAPAAVALIRDLLAERLATPPSLDELAQITGMSGAPPGAYQRERRQHPAAAPAATARTFKKPPAAAP
jgi:hypothetical protein